MKSINDYLPKKYDDVHHVSGRVPMPLYKEVKKMIKLEKLSWSEILTACLNHLVDEKTAQKKKA